MKQLNTTRDCYNKTADQYANAYFDELHSKPLDRLLLQNFASRHKGKGIIGDLGCGPGQTTAFLHQCGIDQLVGIDLSENMVKKARALCPPQISFETGNMCALNYPDHHFSGIIAFYAIVHFEQEELEVPFREIYRVLQKGGQFLFSFHIGSEKKSVEEFLDQKIAIDFYFFDPDILLEQLKKCGFKIADALIRYPYPDKEYPSKRAYFLAEK